MRRIAWVLLLVFVFTIPWEYSLDLGPPLGDVSRVAGLLVMIAMVPTVLQAGRIRAPGSLQWLVLSLFLWFCCSFFWSIDGGLSLGRMRADAQVMMTVWVVWELVENPQDLRDLMRAYVAGSWVLAILTLANFASPDSAGQIRFVAQGQDPNDVARFLDLGLPMAALLLCVEPRWWGKTLAIGYLPLGMAGVVLTASRGGFVAASVAAVGCALLLLRLSLRRAAVGVMTLPALAAAFWFMVPSATIARIATIPEQLMSGDLNQRLNIWAAGVHAFVQAPLLGWGRGSFVAASRLAQIDTAHNTALALAVEGGLVALGLAVGIVVVAWRCVLLLRGPARIGLGTAMIVLLVCSMVATVEGNRSTWFLVALISVAGRLAVESPEAMSLQFQSSDRSLNKLVGAETVT